VAAMSNYDSQPAKIMTDERSSSFSRRRATTDSLGAETE
jgi:hypothetical protein